MATFSVAAPLEKRGGFTLLRLQLIIDQPESFVFQSQEENFDVITWPEPLRLFR